MCYPEYLPPHQIAGRRLEVLMDGQELENGEDLPNNVRDDVIYNVAFDFDGPDAKRLLDEAHCNRLLQHFGFFQRPEDAVELQPSQVDGCCRFTILNYSLPCIGQMRASTKLQRPPSSVVELFIHKALPVRPDLSCWLAKMMIEEIASRYWCTEADISVDIADPTILVYDPEIQNRLDFREFSLLKEELTVIPRVLKAFADYCYQWVVLEAQFQACSLGWDEIQGDEDQDLPIVGVTKAKYVYSMFATQVFGWKWFDVPNFFDGRLARSDEIRAMQKEAALNQEGDAVMEEGEIGEDG